MNAGRVFKSGILSQQQLDLAKATMIRRTRRWGQPRQRHAGRGAGEPEEAAVTVSQTNLNYTVIRSPIDGTVVARKTLTWGQTVAASLQAPTIFTIAQDLTKMLVYAKTDESDVGNIKVGKP